MQINPKVSVVLLVYNHEKFLDQAIQSILSQQVDFDYEIIIIDDFSTDKSREIILSYKKKHPKLIRLFFHKKNYGPIISSRERFSIAKGEYICLLEGDDYWCDDEKLQQQVNVLDKRPSIVGCTHNTMLLDSNSPETIYTCSTSQPETTISFNNIIGGEYYFHTSSYLWRNIFKPRSPISHHNSICGDWLLSMQYAQHGDIAYLNKTMSVYRIHQDGIWSRMDDKIKHLRNIEQLAFINIAFMFKHNNDIDRIWWLSNDLYRQYKGKYNFKDIWIKTQLYLIIKATETNQSRAGQVSHKPSLFGFSLVGRVLTHILLRLKRIETIEFVIRKLAAIQSYTFWTLYYSTKGFYLFHFAPLYKLLSFQLLHIKTFEIRDD